jgi:lysophospholipase L1-like esterase
MDKTAVRNYLNALINKKSDILFVFSGDSHTWGQGAEGWETALKPKFVQGEWRRLPKEIPSFCQLFENYIKEFRRQTGETYVINSGYGCASTRKYLNDFWFPTVEVYQPDIVVLEFAINDWLEDRAVSLNEYEANLITMIEKVNKIGAVPVLLTVSPIRGNLWSGRHYYEDYIERSRKIGLERQDVILADANRLMKEFLLHNGQKGEEMLFYDDWHVSRIGHELYCKALIEAIKG